MFKNLLKLIIDDAYLIVKQSSHNRGQECNTLEGAPATKLSISSRVKT